MPKGILLGVSLNYAHTDNKGRRTIQIMPRRTYHNTDENQFCNDKAKIMKAVESYVDQLLSPPPEASEYKELD